MAARRRRGALSGGRKFLITLVLLVAAFVYQYVRSPSFRRQCEKVVVTGPIVTDADAKTIGRGKVRVPGFYYKVVYDETPPEKMIAFILPNKGSKKSLDSFVVTVDDVEEATGLDFFSALPADVQKRLESHSNPDEWTWRDARRGGRQ